jgi:hypothetical protein
MEFLPYNDDGIVLDGNEVRAGSVSALNAHIGTVLAHLAQQLGCPLPPPDLRLSARREREAERLARDEGKRMSEIGGWCADALKGWYVPLSPAQRTRGYAILARRWERGFAGPIGQLP